jgi:glycosyltransferase involved in cell wall biosynthesis
MHQENQGLGASLNKGISLCQTEYLARMDADDISLPDRLRIQLNYMEKNREVVMLGTQIKFIMGKKEFPGAAIPLNHEEIHKLLMKKKAVMCHGSAMIRTEALRMIKGYRILRAGQDLDVFLRLCEIGNAANLSETLYLIRIHRMSECFAFQKQVNQGWSYAIECALCRRKELEEPTYEEFLRKWDNQNILKRSLAWIDIWSAVEYRTALIDFSESKYLHGLIRLVCAALCRPEGVARRIKYWIRNNEDKERRLLFR